MSVTGDDGVNVGPAGVLSDPVEPVVCEELVARAAAEADGAEGRPARRVTATVATTSPSQMIQMIHITD